MSLQVEATDTIASVVASFLAIQINLANPPAAAATAITQAIDFTSTIMTPYITAEEITVDHTITTLLITPSPHC